MDSVVFEGQLEFGTCKHCRRRIVKLTDDPRELWFHTDQHPTKPGREIIGKQSCRRTRAEPEDA